MASGQYTFVPEKGIVRVTGDLNTRKGLPSRNTAVATILHAGTQQTYIGYVLDGESVGGNTKWYLTSEGDFFWSGNVDAHNTSVVDKILAKPLDTLFCTQKFAERPEYYSTTPGNPKGHNGMDFRTITPGNPNDNKKPVYAVLAGTVSEATENEFNGKFVRILHDNGYESVYLHLSSVGVTKNQKIAMSAQVGISGNSGGSEAPHLHFGYRPHSYDKNNGYMGYIDPAPYFKDEIRYA